MYIKQISILALGLILSHESFAANPVIRAGALRLNTSSSTQSTQSVTNPSSTTGAVASYERASRLRPNRVQIGATSGGAANNANTELLSAVYAEMERVTNAVEQELYVTQKQIDDLKEEIKENKEEIEERDEKIQELEEALGEYEDLKETVKNIPSLYYTKREVDAKGYVLPKTMENAIDVAKTSAINSARDQAVAEIENKGFITADTVYQDIAVAKDKAIENATESALVAVNNMGFVTVEKLNEVVSTERVARQDALKSYATKEQLAANIATAKTAAIDNAVAVVNSRNFATISAVDSAVQKATQNIRQDRENALKPYVTKVQLETDIATAKTAAINDAVAVVDKRGFIKQATAYEIFATKTDLTAVDNKFKNISNTIAVDLAQNDRFKAQVLDGLDSSISELPSKVTRIETKIDSMDRELFIDSVPRFAKKIDMDEFRQTLKDEPTKIIGREKLIDAEYVAGKLPATVCRSKDCLTSMIGDHYTTDSKLALKLGNYTKTDDLGNLQLIKNMNTNISNKRRIKTR